MSEQRVVIHVSSYRMAERMCAFGHAPYCGVLFFFCLVSMDPPLPYFSEKPEETNTDLKWMINWLLDYFELQYPHPLNLPILSPLETNKS